MLQITQKKLISVGKIEGTSQLVHHTSFRIQSISSNKLLSFASFLCWEWTDKFTFSKSQWWSAQSHPWTLSYRKHKHNWNVGLRKHWSYKTRDGQITNSLKNKIPGTMNHPTWNFDQTVRYLTDYGLVVPFNPPNSRLKSQYLTVISKSNDIWCTLSNYTKHFVQVH